MIVVSITRTEKGFAALEMSAGFAALRRPRVEGERANWWHRKLLIPPSIDDPRTCFADLAKEFACWLQEDTVTVLVAEIKPMALNPLLPGYESLLAMLILAFPEIRWLFGTIRGYSDEGNEDSKSHNGQLNEFRKAHGLQYLFQPWQAPLFDGSGLRDWVRRRAVEHNATKDDACYIPRREQLTIALDEEIDYAYLHAYTAYRFGFRALAISEKRAADAVLGPNAVSPWGIPKVVFEDLFLNFPDGGGGLSDLFERDKAFPVLEKTRHRILVTSGQRVAGDAEKTAGNKRYIAAQRGKGRNIRFFYKPHAGIFAVWEKSSLERKLRWREKAGKVSRDAGKSYIWPPNWSKIERESRERGSADGSGHSSPGILLSIARHLLDRAESMLANDLSSVERAVKGAVLATEALELLGGKTPTTAAEALSLKHRFELHAECQFTGVEHHIPLRHRFKELEHDAESIARWFRPQERRKAILNIRMNIANHLVGILRQYNQFDEEHECLNQVRYVHNSLYMYDRPWRYVFWPVLRYSEFLLSSFLKFTLAIFLWIGGLTLLFGVNSITPGVIDTTDGLSPFGHAVGTFFGIGLYPLSIVFSVFSIVAGIAHLGIFISHLYVLVSKR